MVTRATTTGKYRYWQKSTVVAVVAVALFATGRYLEHDNLQWAAGAIFILAGWYGIMSFFEYIDKS